VLEYQHLNSESFGQNNADKIPIIVIHGWANSIETVRPLALALSNYSKTYAIDLPGHGLTPVPETVFGIEDFAQALKSYLDANQLKRVHLVGHSVGGKTAIKFAYLYPESVGKLVLIGASGLKPKQTLIKKIRATALRYLRFFIRFKNTELGMKIYRDWYIPRFASRDYLNAGPMTKSFVKIVNQQLKSDLATIKHQTLLIWGELDQESPIEVGKQMNKLIKNSELIALPNQGHYPFIGTSASLVVKYIRDFLTA
jgi:pimeloyl-ACP methyl ester carboxylesterase